MWTQLVWQGRPEPSPKSKPIFWHLNFQADIFPMMFRALLIPPHRVREFLYLQLREVRSGKWCAAARLPRAGRCHAPELPQGISAPLADVKLPGRLKIELKTRDQSWWRAVGGPDWCWHLLLSLHFIAARPEGCSVAELRLASQGEGRVGRGGGGRRQLWLHSDG